jgi:hypothetical protein
MTLNTRLARMKCKSMATKLRVGIVSDGGLTPQQVREEEARHVRWFKCYLPCSMIEAHMMLSLKGSLQPDPFHPTYSLQPTNPIESQPTDSGTSTTSASEPTTRREIAEGSEDEDGDDDNKVDNDDINDNDYHEKEKGRPRRKVRFNLHMEPIPSDPEDE